MSGFDFKIINQSIDEDKKDDKIIEDNNKSDNLTLF